MIPYGMTKIISASGWDYGERICTPIKISSRGLIGSDRTEFIKRASHAFAKVIDNLKFAADEEPVHVLSHGAFEGWGFNRNGDGFREETCRRDHKTFEKFARVYRSHKNKDPNESYGKIAHAAYNEDMRRVELLWALNKTKSAADRNGGHIADKELAKLARGEDLATSMAAHVPHDTCSFCKKASRRREEYCTAETCGAGGCAENLTRLVKIGKDLHQLGVFNPYARWFDSSHVVRPADRTAYGTQADWLTKAAGDAFDGRYGCCSAKLAEDLGVFAPMAVLLEQETQLLSQLPEAVQLQVKIASGLAKIGSRGCSTAIEAVRRAFDPKVRGDFDVSVLGEPGTRKCAEALGALAEQKIVLPLREFARLVKKAELAAGAAKVLPSVYEKIASDETTHAALADNAYAPSMKMAAPFLRLKAIGLFDRWSLDKDAVERRALTSSCRTREYKTSFEKSAAAATPEAEALARDYASYALAALQKIAAWDEDFMTTARLVLVQNSVV